MSPMGRVLGAALAPLLAGCLGLAVYSSSWGALRRNKGLHRILGGVSLLALLGGMYSGLNIGVAWGLGHGTTAASLTETLWLPAAWEVGAVWAAILGNGLGAAGVFGMGYLLLRRNKDDFGRDYYRFAMGRAALLGLILPLPVAIGAAWLGLCGLARSPDVATPLAVAGVAALAAVWLNARVMRSRHPLRLKGEVIAACLLAAILDAALALSLLSSVLEIPLPASLPI
jgi:hypothetical protein